MLGNYQYAPVKVVIARFEEPKGADKKDKDKEKQPKESLDEDKDIVFVEGDYYDG